MDMRDEGHRPTTREIGAAWVFCGTLFLLLVLVPLIATLADWVPYAELLEEARSLLGG